MSSPTADVALIGLAVMGLTSGDTNTWTQVGN